MLASRPCFDSAVRFRWLALLLAILVAGFASTDAQASKGKKHSRYWGSATASGEWQQSSSCGGTFYNYTSKWNFEGVYGKTLPSLGPGGELDLNLGGASGSIDWSVDELCNGSVESGKCSVGLGEDALPIFFEKAKGGLKVDFQLSLSALGCGDAQVAPYGQGFEAFDLVDNEPSGFIPSKKIGKKSITVQISGNGSGNAGEGSRSFSGQMSGTLTLTRKKPIQSVPDS